MLNKVDRSIVEFKNDGETIYQQFFKVINMANIVTSTYPSEEMGQVMFDPSLGNVAFGSGQDQWAFTITKFARIYSKKFDI